MRYRGASYDEAGLSAAIFCKSHGLEPKGGLFTGKLRRTLENFHFYICNYRKKSYIYRSAECHYSIIFTEILLTFRCSCLNIY